MVSARQELAMACVTASGEGQAVPCGSSYISSVASGKDRVMFKNDRLKKKTKKTTSDHQGGT
jgi:hypothetical protein